MTLREVAKSMNDMGLPFHHTWVSRIEMGITQQPEVAGINALARILPVSVDEMVKAIGYDVGPYDLAPEDQELLQNVHSLPEHAQLAIRGLARLWRQNPTAAGLSVQEEEEPRRIGER